MNKFTSTFTLLFLIETALVVNAHAMRTAQRPWFAHHSGASAPALGADRTSVTRIRHTHRHLTGSARKGERIVSQARRYEGSRYRFGGDSKAKGFDCSGLVRRIYNDLHLDRLPHSADGLYHMGRPVHMNELRPGDLVFFKNTYRRGISHVGVYVGDNHFIHAQNRRNGVTVTALSEPYYQLHYAGARRLY